MLDLRSAIEKLLRRPPFWRADPPLPVVLVTGEHADAVVTALAEPFKDSVPYACLDDQRGTIIDLVRTLAGEHGRLGNPVGGSFLPAPRFPLAQFVIWAREQRDDPPKPRPDPWPPHPDTGFKEFRLRLKRRRQERYGGARRTRISLDFVARAAATWVPLGTLVVLVLNFAIDSVLPPWLSDLRPGWLSEHATDVLGVVPWTLGFLLVLVGTAAQGVLSIRGSIFTGWFRRQPYLRRKRFERLPHYALRLANASDDEIDRLLVHAMVRDLGEAYTKWIFPWPSLGRGLYALLVLRGAGEGRVNAKFLRLLEESTYRTGLLPPMVVLATVPKGGVPRDESDPVKYDRFAESLRLWRRSARRRGPDLRLRVHAPSRPPAAQPSRPMAPRRGRALTYWAVVALLVAGPVAGLLFVQDWLRERCGGLPHARLVGKECVGVVNADRPTPAELFDQHMLNGEMRGLIEGIDRNNKFAERSGQYIDVVLFGEYSIREAMPADTRVVASKAELTAAAAYQATVTGTPRLRILIANGGDTFSQGAKAAELVRALALKDESHVMGVVGFPRSVQGVSEAIGVLHPAKIPMVSNTANADTIGFVGARGLGRPSPYYFHMAATNHREAGLMALFAKGKGLVKKDDTAVIVRDRSTRDGYTNNLADDLKKALEDHVKIKGVKEVPYTENGGLSAAASEACQDDKDDKDDKGDKGDKRDVVFYAGRSSDFLDFLISVEGRDCRDATVIAGDDVGKVMAGDGAEKVADMRQVKVFYMALAPRDIWEGEDALPTGFVQSLLDPFSAGSELSDDNLILTYDAVAVVHRAVSLAYGAANVPPDQQGQGKVLNWGDILLELNKTTDHHQVWAGSGGVVDFRAKWHTPRDKTIAVMEVTDEEPDYTKLVRHCGRLDTAKTLPKGVCKDLGDVADLPEPSPSHPGQAPG
ncbi:ABC transporter substrate-binding protein [Nonomuraea rhizosphaerae]|uniref:ABC transporter substrate-binding protein n=1 Tax=Nonomuraea rhizosphaerae TaxID=2665663 RepID=UPI001C5EDFD9|nr:ABC transporter substrate-binding protein [Nonomuraea rhizosphaerae]